ncbi:MAG: RNA methyltransferase substrate-binding domain-containing protein, partial [Oscillospiraceae bacterium]
MQDNFNDNDNSNDIVFGKNSVVEALKSVDSADTLYLSADDNDKSISYIVAMAKEKGAVVKKIHATKMKKICSSERHQGVALLCPLCEYCTIDDIFA